MPEVSHKYNVPLDRLLNHLQWMGKFTRLDERLGTVSLTADPQRAGGWANRAPEATWEALWSVYALRHTDLGGSYYQSDEGHFWVMAQMMADPPAIVGAAAPMAALRSWQWSAGDTALEILERLIAQGCTVDDFTDLYMRKPEWRAEIGEVTFIVIQPAPIRLERHVVMFMSGEEPEPFNHQLRAGDWGEPVGYDQVGMPWWSFGEDWSRLSAERRAQLEDTAGLGLSP